MISRVDSLNDDLEHFAAAVAGPHGQGLLNLIQEIETTSHHVCEKGFFIFISLKFLIDYCILDNMLVEP